jgi:hypothetical protein
MMKECVPTLSGVMAGLSLSKTGVNALLPPAIHVLVFGANEDVDARAERGHDESKNTIGGVHQ